LGSQSHSTGTPQRPGLASSRGAVAIAAHRRETEADMRMAVYVQPLGKLWHLVKNYCNDQVYRVTSRAGLTFSPGSVVVLGSNTGHPGEFIISEPAGGRRGASVQGTVTVLRTAPFSAGASLANRAHLGLGFDGDILRAYRYLGGTYDSEIASVDCAAVLGGTIQSFCMLSLSPLVIAWSQTTRQAIVVNFTAESVSGPYTMASGGGSTNTPRLYTGGKSGECYWVRRSASSDFYKLWKLETDGTQTEVTPAGLETVSPDLVGTGTGLFFIADGVALMPVYGGVGDRGYVRMGNFQSEFIANADWIAFDSDSSEWGNWIGHGVIPDGTVLASVPTGTASVSASGLGTVAMGAPSLAQFITESQMTGLVADTADASPDGQTAVIYNSSDQCAHVRIGSSDTPAWEPVDDMPIGGKPGQMWCLD
jgi:hypothetical protein